MDLYRRKGTRYYWCRGRDVDGRVWRQSTHQTERGAAAIAGRAIERRILLAAGAAQNTATLADGLALVEAHDVRANRAAGTREYHATKGGHLTRLLGSARVLAELGPSDLQAYADKRIAEGADRHTVHKDFVVLRFAARLAGAPIPLAAVPDLGKVYVPRDRWLTEAEYRRLLLAMPAHRRDWLIAFCHTGVRHSELYRLRAEHVHAARKVLMVPGTKTAASVREIPLDADALELLTRRAAAAGEGRLFPWYDKHPFRMLMLRACKRAKIAFVTPNDMRRTFCSWLAQAGVSEGKAARILGNSSRMVRRVYQQFAAEHLADAVANLPSVTAGRAQPRAQSKRRGAKA